LPAGCHDDLQTGFARCPSDRHAVTPEIPILRAEEDDFAG
jgi:hypothetical protein